MITRNTRQNINRKLNAGTPEQFKEMKQAALDMEQQINAIRETAAVLKEWFPDYVADIDILCEEDITYLDCGYADIPNDDRTEDRRLNFIQRCISFIKFIKEHH